jgi:hypothetical protein
MQAECAVIGAWTTTIEQKIASFTQQECKAAYEVWNSGSEIGERFASEVAPVFSHKLRDCIDLMEELRHIKEAIQAVFTSKFIDEFMRETGVLDLQKFLKFLDARQKALDQEAELNVGLLRG